MSLNPPKPSKAHLMTYRIGRGETGVLTYEPYKSQLLPHWRFKTAAIARASSRTLWREFLAYHDARDFVGMDMARKFIQMGMTRAKRYANYQGGRKYVGGKEGGVQREKSEGHAGKQEKEEASKVFRAVWERCRAHEGYQTLKKEFQREQKEWDRARKEETDVKDEDEVSIKMEEEEEESKAA